MSATCCASTLTPSSGRAPEYPWPSLLNECLMLRVFAHFPGGVIESPASIPLLPPRFPCSVFCYYYFTENLGRHPLGRDSQSRNLDPFTFGKFFSRERGFSLKRAHYRELFLARRRPHSRGSLMPQGCFTAAPRRDLPHCHHVLHGSLLRVGGWACWALARETASFIVWSLH